MNFKIILYFLVFFLILSCDEGAIIINGLLCDDERGKCEKNILVGEVLLSEQTNAIFTFRKGDTLVFKNEQGSELNFETRPSNKISIRQNGELLCSSCAGDDQYEFYNIEKRTGRFYAIGETTLELFLIKAEIKLYHDSFPNKHLFYEELTIITDFIDSNSERIMIIPNIYEAIGAFSLDFVSQNESYNFQETLTLLDQNFENVYSSLDNGQPIIYFSFLKGIIGFDIAGEIWLFDGIK